MVRMRMSRAAAVVVGVLVVNACEDGVGPVPPVTSATVEAQLSIGPGGAHCWEGSLATDGAISFSGGQMNFFAASRNDCWPGTVHVQADLYWGAVSDCSQPVPKMINGYGSPDPNQNFYENPATYYVSVARSHPLPAGSLVKAVMVQTHRFWHYGYGAYGGPYTEVPGATTLCQGPPPPSPVGVWVHGPGYVDQPGTYHFSAVASGGNGSYTYQWYVTHGWSGSWNALGTGSGQSVGIYEGQGDVRMRVVVSSAGTAAEAQSYTQNAIGCGGVILC